MKTMIFNRYLYSVFNDKYIRFQFICSRQDAESTQSGGPRKFLVIIKSYSKHELTGYFR